MSSPYVARVRSYSLVPSTTTQQRYVGTDTPFALSMEVLRVTLSTGVEGVASCCSGWRGAPVGRLAHMSAARAGRAIGQFGKSPAIAAQSVAEADRKDTPDILASLLDVALWDAMARDIGRPIQSLICGHRGPIPCYASTPAYQEIEAYLQDVETAIALGCKGVKFHFNGDPAFDLALVHAVDQRYGSRGMHFMADLEGEYRYDDALRLGQVLSDRAWLWLEAPFPDADLDAYVELNRAVQIDIVPSGYELVGPAFWAQALSMGAFSRLRLDVCLSGGISGSLAALALARMHGVPVEFQSFGYLPAQAANLVLMRAGSADSMFELPLPVADFEFAGRKGLRLDADGFVSLPEGPGLGIEMDWDQIEQQSVVFHDTGA